MTENDSQSECIENKVKTIKAVFSFVAFLLILIGQIFQYSTQILSESQIPAPFWISVAGGVLFVVAQFTLFPKFLAPFFDRLHLFRIPPTIVLSVIFSILTILTMLSLQKISRGGYIPVVSFWFFCGISFLATFIRMSDLGNVLIWFKKNRNEILIVLGITLLAAFVRFYQLGIYPKVVNGDEGRIGLAALSTASDRLANPFEYFENIGGFYLQIMNALFNLFGASAFTLRFQSAIGGVLAIAATYLLARELMGRRIATISAITLAISHSHIHFSRTAAVPYIQDTWMVPLELFLLFSGIQKKSSWRTAAAGILLAFHFNYYLSAQITIGFIIVFVILGFIFFRKWIAAGVRQLAVLVTGFLLLTAPQIVVIIQSPGEFFNRLNNDGTLQSGWLNNTMQETGNSVIQILFERLTHSFFSLSFFPNVDFYGSPVPMLTLIAAACFLLGVIISLSRTKDLRYFFINGILWSFIFAVGLFSLPPSADTYRLLIALPVSMILVAIGLDFTLDSLKISWTSSKFLYGFSVGAVLLSLLATNLWVYYGEFVGRCQYEGTAHGRFASYLGDYALNIKPGINLYLLSDDIYFAGSHASTEFLSHNRKIVNSKDPIDRLQIVPGDVIVAPIDRMEELRQFALKFPGGKWHEEYDCNKLILLAYEMPGLVWTQPNTN